MALRIIHDRYEFERLTGVHVPARAKRVTSGQYAYRPPKPEPLRKRMEAFLDDIAESSHGTYFLQGALVLLIGSLMGFILGVVVTTHLYALSHPTARKAFPAAGSTPPRRR